MSEPKTGRTTRLLGIAALGTSAAVCGAGGIAMAVLSSRGGGSGTEPPPPGNPKGSFYEAPDVPSPDAGPSGLPMPGNPKGSLYEDPPGSPATGTRPVPESPPPSKR